MHLKMPKNRSPPISITNNAIIDKIRETKPKRLLDVICQITSSTCELQE